MNTTVAPLPTVPTPGFELARRVRSFYGLMVHIARLAECSKAHVSFVVCGARVSDRVMRIALRELDRAEAGKFRRAA